MWRTDIHTYKHTYRKWLLNVLSDVKIYPKSLNLLADQSSPGHKRRHSSDQYPSNQIRFILNKVRAKYCFGKLFYSQKSCNLLWPTPATRRDNHVNFISTNRSQALLTIDQLGGRKLTPLPSLATNMIISKIMIAWFNIRREVPSSFKPSHSDNFINIKGTKGC